MTRTFRNALTGTPAGRKWHAVRAGQQEERLMNERLLDGRVAIITGASRGIGAATARAFAAEGAAVALAARDAAALTALADDLRASGGRAIAVPTDVGE